jgi:hypothetical protein
LTPSVDVGISLMSCTIACVVLWVWMKNLSYKCFPISGKNFVALPKLIICSTKYFNILILTQIQKENYFCWIYSYLCNQCLSPMMLWVWISIRVRCTTLCDKVCHWLVTGRWFSPGPPVSSTNKTDCHDITEILLIHHQTNKTNKRWTGFKLTTFVVIGTDCTLWSIY